MSRALLLAVALSAIGPPAVAAGPTPAALKRGAAQCLARRNEDACDDAVRWNPSDPALLVALADLELRAQHPADAQLHPKHKAVGARPVQVQPTAKPTALSRQFSNTESPTESH